MNATQDTPIRMLAISVRADIGGGPEHMFQLFQNYGHVVDLSIACPQEAPYWDRFGKVVGARKLIEIPHRAFKLGALFKLAKYIKTHKINVVHSHGKGAGLYARALRLLTGVRCMHTFHGLHVGEYGAAKKALYLVLERLMGRLTDATISVSDSEREEILRNRLVRHDHLHVIPNGVFIPEVVTIAPDPEQLRIVAVSRYNYHKNPDMMIDIANGLAAKSQPFHLTILGDGEEFAQIETRIKQESLSDRVTLTGNHPAPREMFRQNDIFLSTSRWEGMPMAVLEAMSEGLCPVVTKVVGHTDIIQHTKNGLMFETADNAIDQLCAIISDDVEKLGNAARTDARDRYSVAQMAKLTQTIAQSLVSAPVGTTDA